MDEKGGFIERLEESMEPAHFWWNCFKFHLSTIMTNVDFRTRNSFSIVPAQGSTFSLLVNPERSVIRIKEKKESNYKKGKKNLNEYSISIDQ